MSGSILIILLTLPLGLGLVTPVKAATPEQPISFVIHKRVFKDSERLKTRENTGLPISPTGSADKDLVDGIIFLSSFPCGVDSLVNELVIRKIDNVPCINIILDDSTSTGGLYTRLESFVDIIKARHNNG